MTGCSAAPSLSRRRFAAAAAASLAAGVAPTAARADACLYPPRGTLAYTVREDGAAAGGVTFAFDFQDGAFVALKTVRIVRRRGGRPVVRLRQKVQEVWVDGWLHELKARTERAGETSTLEGARRDRGLSLRRGDGAKFNVAGYILADTLWHRDTPYERGLLDVESGHLRLMRGYPRGRERVPGFDGATNARHFLIRGEIGLELWYDDTCRLVRAAYRTPDDRRVVWVARRA